MRNGPISLMAQQETASSPLAEALARVGDRWTLLVVEVLLAGPQRFNDLLGQLPGIAANIQRSLSRHRHLSRRLVASAVSPALQVDERLRATGRVALRGSHLCPQRFRPKRSSCDRW